MTTSEPAPLAAFLDRPRGGADASPTASSDASPLPRAERRPHGLPGFFVALEGGDGSGKSTQMGLLGQWTQRTGIPAVLTREPGGTKLGRELRGHVLHGGEMDARTEALLYAADRAHHVETMIRPALARGELVVTDRYLDSSIAYQGGGRGLGAQEVRDLSLWATRGLLPDLVVLLDVDPAEGAARRFAREGHTEDRLEAAGAEFHESVRARFLDLAAADPGRYLVVDAALPPDLIHQLVTAEILARRAAHTADAALAAESHARSEGGPR